MKKIINFILLIVTISFSVSNVSAQVPDNQHFKLASVKKVDSKTLRVEGYKVTGNFQQHLMTVLVSKNNADPKMDKQLSTLTVILSPADTVGVDKTMLSVKNDDFNYFIYSDANKNGGFMRLNTDGVKGIELLFESVKIKN